MAMKNEYEKQSSKIQSLTCVMKKLKLTGFKLHLKLWTYLKVTKYKIRALPRSIEVLKASSGEHFNVQIM